MPSPQVVDVELDRAATLRVSYEDGVTAQFDLLDLRRGCPCAGCRGRREQDLPVYAGDTITATHGDLHGNWGIAIRWSDGHDTGIYAWDLLRRWWDASQD